MALAERIQHWRRLRAIAPLEEQPAVAKGREAEAILAQLLGLHENYKGAYLLTGRRIPSQRLGRRSEIDLIVCTPQMIHLIEIKNWSGQLVAENGVWRQMRRGGKVVEHLNPIERNLEKRDIVVEYLRNCGIQIDREFAEKYVRQKVIFMNARLQLDPRLRKHPDVISRAKLDEYLGRQKRPNVAQRWMASIIDCCLDSELGAKLSHELLNRMPQEQFEAIVASLSKTSTWDHLHLYGTKILGGDLLELRVAGRIYRREELERLSGGLPIRLRWIRGRLRGLFHALTGLGSLGKIYLGHSRLRASPADTLLFHEVGTKDPVVRTLADVDQIVLG